MDAARAFYVDKLGCGLGRHNRHPMVLNLQGNQLVAQLRQESQPLPKSIYPRHYGLIFLERASWRKFANRCRERSIPFFHPHRKRHEGEETEHEKFFIRDPANNILEFKYYRYTEAIFGACREGGGGVVP